MLHFARVCRLPAGSQLDSVCLCVLEQIEFIGIVSTSQFVGRYISCMLNAQYLLNAAKIYNHPVCVLCIHRRKSVVALCTLVFGTNYDICRINNPQHQRDESL